MARRIAHLSYRSAEELHRRFGRSPQTGEDPWSWRPEGRGGRFAIASYLDHQAEKLVRRFDANSYVRLTRAMSLFDLGHGRGGTERALAAIRVPFTVVGMDTDRLFPLVQQRHIVEAAPAASGLEVIRSLHGHDGFLVETGQMDRLMRRHLEKLAGGS